MGATALPKPESTAPQATILLGVDTGGTFTDFVCVEAGRLRTHKVLSTPSAPEQAILQGVQALGLQGRAFYLVHGSTVATNAVLEGKGVRTAYISNYGLGDVLTIGRQARRELYNLQPQSLAPPVPAQLCLETGGRVGADGGIVEPLSEEECAVLLERIETLAPQAVAINLLFSFVDDRFEREIEQLLPASLFVSRSSEILPEQREYERGIATWLNAWVGPLVEGYVQRLRHSVAPAPVHVMQSSGVTMRADLAARRAVNLLLSGPAGGLMGARHIGAALERRQLLTFDMGGTSTDVALIDQDVMLTSEGRIGPYPVAVPMVDMHTIGAGGGSIASVDAGGMLVVGPESAGADPGPACYGQGGQRATVTDANLVLGRLLPDAFLGGRMPLDVAAAQRVIGQLGRHLGVSAERAAQGVIDLANEHMAQALRVISVQRGMDPADFTLTAFGGAGGLHVCALAEMLGMCRALLPRHAGVLSALGMLAAPRGRQLSHTRCGLMAEQDPELLRQQFETLARQGREQLYEEGVADAAIRCTYSMDLRYLGQSYTLNVRWRSVEQAIRDFHLAHLQRFGHRLEAAVELVNLRASLSASATGFTLDAGDGNVKDKPAEGAWPGSHTAAVPVWRRCEVAAAGTVTGPLLVIDPDASSYVAPGWCATWHASGCLLLERMGPEKSC